MAFDINAGSHNQAQPSGYGHTQADGRAVIPPGRRSAYDRDVTHGDSQV